MDGRLLLLVFALAVRAPPMPPPMTVNATHKQVMLHLPINPQTPITVMMPASG